MRDYQHVLAEARFPTTVIVLDFETYFTDEYTLKGKNKVSIVEYVMDPRFEVTGLGTGWFDGNEVGSFYYPTEIQEILTGINFDEVTIVGQNLFFDALILREHYGITPKYTVDLIDLERMWDARASHALAKMAPRWGLDKPKGDTSQFMGYHANDMPPNIHKKFVEYTLTDIELESDLFQLMMPVVVSRPEVEIPVAAHTLKMFLNPKFKVDMEQGARLQTRMQLEMAKAVSAAGDVLGYDCGHEDISKACFIPEFAEVLERHGEKMPMKQGKKKMIPALSKEDQPMEELLTHPVDEIRILAEAKLAVGSWPLHIKKVKAIMAQAGARGGMIGSPLKYHSAHTGRWGGGQGINLQNLGGRGRTGHGTHPLIAAVRALFLAPEGYVLGLPDYTSIEARMLAWFAGQDDLVKDFACGNDLYSDFAATLFKEEVWKWSEDDIIEHERFTKLQDREFEALKSKIKMLRGFGKDAILGCGYGMGSDTFYHNCYINPGLRPYFDDGTYDLKFIQRLIKLYRSKYAKIPKFWRQIEAAWRFVTTYKDQSKEVGGLLFWAQGNATYITLPSGRDFRYPEARVNIKTGELRFKYSKLYGAALAEHVTQAAARDLLAEAILRLDDAGFNIALHVHDEADPLLPIETAEEDLARAIKIMEIVPAWARGLPIAVSGELSPCYKK